jgi:arsenate reductase
MPERPTQVLFLCTGNSARSILAEVILNKLGQGRFRAHSAGSHPKGAVNPNTIRLLQDLGYDTADLRSKSWGEFARSPEFDLIITVCDDAAGEACPVWPGRPATAHWGIPDPAAVQGSPSEIAAAFKKTHELLTQRIVRLATLPVPELDQATLQSKVRDIGRGDGATAMAVTQDP